MMGALMQPRAMLKVVGAHKNIPSSSRCSIKPDDCQVSVQPILAHTASAQDQLRACAVCFSWMVLHHRVTVITAGLQLVSDGLLPAAARRLATVHPQPWVPCTDTHSPLVQNARNNWLGASPTSSCWAGTTPCSPLYSSLEAGNQGESKGKLLSQLLSQLHDVPCIPGQHLPQNHHRHHQPSTTLAVHGSMAAQLAPVAR